MAALTSLSIREMRDLLARREVSALDLARAHLDRIEALDESTVRSLLTVTREVAEKQARQADDRLAAGDTAPLLGVPMILKDVMVTRGIRTTAGSRILENFVPIEDGTITRRLAEAGSVLLGKSNMDEFAMGSSTENSGYFPTRNPWDLERVPGRLQRRLGGGGGRRVRTVCAGHRHGRVHPSARGAVRRRRLQADVRPRQPLWPDRLRLIAGPDRAAVAHGRRHRAGDERHRRPRPVRLDLARRAGPRTTPPR